MKTLLKDNPSIFMVTHFRLENVKVGDEHNRCLQSILNEGSFKVSIKSSVLWTMMLCLTQTESK